MIFLYGNIAIRVSQVTRDLKLPKWCDWNINISDGHSSFWILAPFDTSSC